MSDLKDSDKRLTPAQLNGEAPVPHPLTPEANVEPKPGEISDPENASKVAKDEDIEKTKKGK